MFASPYEALVIDFTLGINDFTRLIISRIFNKPLISALSAANIIVKVIPVYLFVIKLLNCQKSYDENLKSCVN